MSLKVRLKCFAFQGGKTCGTPSAANDNDTAVDAVARAILSMIEEQFDDPAEHENDDNYVLSFGRLKVVAWPIVPRHLPS